jgi:hypothetical protein
MSATARLVAILGGNRIPFSRSNGAYTNASNQDSYELAGERRPTGATLTVDVGPQICGRA